MGVSTGCIAHLCQKVRLESRVAELRHHEKTRPRRVRAARGARFVNCEVRMWHVYTPHAQALRRTHDAGRRTRIKSALRWGPAARTKAMKSTWLSACTVRVALFVRCGNLVRGASVNEAPRARG